MSDVAGLERARSRIARLAALACGGMMLAGLPGCDYFAQRDLKPGESTVADVRKYMGKPEVIWEAEDGSQTFEYVRGPAGRETYMVEIGPDGKFRGMRNVLVAETFQQIKPGMSSDDVRRLLGKPTDAIVYKLKKEEVWSWRTTGDQQRPMMFNVHFNLDHTVRATSMSVDPQAANY